MTQQLIDSYQAVRQKTLELCQPLAIEDYVIQSMTDTSPPKWHLAHTTWFFETFILSAYLKNYKFFDPHYHYLFNSYYQSLGLPYPRSQRGLLARPTVETILNYRAYVDAQMLEFITKEMNSYSDLNQLVQLGLEHEQQHQELLLMDIKHNFAINPLNIAYGTKESNFKVIKPKTSSQFIYMAGGLIEMGHCNKNFCFDNELPLHSHYLKPYLIRSTLVNNEEFCEFIENGGYQKPEHWLSDGWDYALQQHWQAPLYWQKINDQWYTFTLSGLKPLNLAEPVCHISFYEADAFARWAGKRLPLESEWEHFASSFINSSDFSGNFLESGYFHPQITEENDSSTPKQLLGDVWEWTASPYTPYPGYKASNNALGEYNGKFMVNQMVLRGGCCLSPKSHIRLSYRNFFLPDKRWQCSGLRLAADE